MLERCGEIDEVGDGERQVERHVGKRVASSAVPRRQLLDEGIPAGAAEREDLVQRAERLDLDHFRAVAPAEPGRPAGGREDAEPAQKCEVTPAGLVSGDVSSDHE